MDKTCSCCNQPAVWRICRYGYYNWRFVCAEHMNRIADDLLSGEWENYTVEIRRVTTTGKGH